MWRDLDNSMLSGSMATIRLRLPLQPHASWKYSLERISQDVTRIYKRKYDLMNGSFYTERFPRLTQFAIYDVIFVGSIELHLCHGNCLALCRDCVLQTFFD